MNFLNETNNKCSKKIYFIYAQESDGDLCGLLVTMPAQKPILVNSLIFKNLNKKYNAE